MPGVRGSVWVSLVALVLAGCVQEAAGDRFDPIPAPEWHPGYQWNYTLSSSTYGASSESGAPWGDTAASLGLVVFNATLGDRGAGQYFVAVAADPEAVRGHPLYREPYLAFEAATGQIAAACNPYSCYESSSEPYLYYPGPSSCRPGRQEALSPAAPTVGFPRPQFPLEYGNETTGRLTYEIARDVPYAARTLGMEEVDVPAGRFRAVHVVIEFAKGSPGRAVPTGHPLYGQEGVAFEFWYAPAVQNYVKETAHWRYVTEHGNSFTSAQALELESFELRRKPGRPAPPLGGDGPAPFAIASDTAFPLVLDGSLRTVRFAPVPAAPYAAGQYPPLEHRSDLAPVPHRAEWRFDWSLSQGELRVKGQGDVFERAFSSPSPAEITARLYWPRCETGLASARAGLGFLQATSWAFTMRAGEQSAVEVGNFTVHPGAHFGNVSWGVDAGSASPAGRLTLVDPLGRVVEGIGNEAQRLTFLADPPGLWRVRWDPDVASFGERIRFDLSIDYPAP